MKRAFFLLSTTGCILLLVSFFLSTFAQSSFIPVEWTPQVSPSEECGLAITSNLSDALVTVAQLVKSTTSSSSLPKSCMEIKESSPISPSGYYAVSNGTGGSAIVYCNMEELYSCPSLEQAMKGFSNTLIGVSNSVTGISNNLMGVSNNVTGISSNLMGVSNTVAGISSNLTEVSNTLTGVSNTLATNDTYDTISISCQEVWDKCPECTNGYYKILAADLTEKNVHCNFEEKCGIAGPWTRVAFLNMSDCSSVCPSGTQKFASGSTVACGLQEPSDSKCISIITPTTHTYSHICGQVAGYQKGSGDGFPTSTNDINGIYVDGVSITRGSPRQHVWSYAIGHHENFYKSSLLGHICPCGATSTMQVPSFVGSDYYCESGCLGVNDISTIYSDDVLWDGQQCGDLETRCCCNTTIPGQPWFHKVLDTPSNDSIELRLCISEHTTNENVLVSLYDIYVK